MPPPFLGSSLQSFPLARIAYLSRDRLLPCSYPPVCGSASSLVVRLLVSPTPTLSRGCLGSPGGYGLPFRGPRPPSRSSWTRVGGVTPFRQLHLLRSFVPLANPFATTSSCPWVVGRCSPGFFLSEAFSVHALGSRPTRSKIEHDPGFATSWDLQPLVVG